MTAVTRPIRAALVVVALALTSTAVSPVGAVAAPASRDPSGVLQVGDDHATVVRDEFGRPRIFARTNYGLFQAYGFAVAQDRLWQLELNRRAARGRLAELFGRGSSAADVYARTVGYTDSELDAQFASLDREEKEIYEAYRDGINRYLEEVVRPDPANKLPYEFHALGAFPAPWETRDSVAFGAFMTRRFGEIGGRHLTNQDLLDDLITRFGPDAGYEAFDDVRWINDPDAPVTVPLDQARPRGTRGGHTAAPTAPRLSAQLQGAGSPWADLEADAVKVWESLGIVTKLGSYAWVISPGHSANGSAMLYGGPQMGFNAPEVLHEVQLTGGSGFDVTGMAFAGVPAILIGYNRDVAWTSTTATGGNVDTYLETICGRDAYVFKGACLPMESRQETIPIRGEPALSLTVRRTVHGPVTGVSGSVAVTQKRAHWGREIETGKAFLSFDRAHNLKEFRSGVVQVVTSHNFLYADREGNIAYWQAGQVPLRPEGFDLRLPFPGDGSAEWPGGIIPMPESINPAQGWLANWNNKPSAGYDNADSQIFGKQFRLLDLEDLLQAGPISLDGMRVIPKDIARIGGLGREARYLRPYLFKALKAVPPSHRLAPAAREILTDWDGSLIADAISSTRLEPGEVIFSAWLQRMIVNTFTDALGTRIGEASTNLLIHVLDDALGDGSGVPPSRDYFAGADPRRTITADFDQALTDLERTLGGDPHQWRPARPITDFRHPIVGSVGTIPSSNRATYAQIVVLGRDGVEAENIFSLGQSGFIQRQPLGGFALDPHFRDQLDLFRTFEYKPMPIADRPGE